MQNIFRMETDQSRRAREIAESYGFLCDVFYHEHTGRTTEDAEHALGIGAEGIIKSLLLVSKKGEYVAAIVRGSDRLDFKRLEQLCGYKKLRMAKPDDISRVLGFEIGGIPPVVFREKGILTYVDTGVVGMDEVVGAGGSPHHGMRFNPRQLVDILQYTAADIVKERV
jgi:prolyl-tRNA editing enzyme YbaK/EbsC (Cys-tRNA(Pro) deacylase)